MHEHGELGFAPGLTYVFSHRGELLVQRTLPGIFCLCARNLFLKMHTLKDGVDVQVAFMPVTQRINGTIVHFDPRAGHVLG